MDTLDACIYSPSEWPKSSPSKHDWTDSIAERRRPFNEVIKGDVLKHNDASSTLQRRSVLPKSNAWCCIAAFLREQRSQFLRRTELLVPCSQEMGHSIVGRSCVLPSRHLSLECDGLCSSDRARCYRHRRTERRLYVTLCVYVAASKLHLVSPEGNAFL